MEYKDLKPGMIIHFSNDWHMDKMDGVDDVEDINCHTEGIVVVLRVTEKDIKSGGVLAEMPGLYGFRGLWYKGNGTKFKSYGKIYDLKDCNKINVLHNSLYGLSKKEISRIVDSPWQEILQEYGTCIS